MTAHVIENGYDFGVPTDLLLDDNELLNLPVDVVDARVEQRAAWRPTVVPDPPAPSATALAAQVAEASALDDRPDATVTNLGSSFTYDGETYWIRPADDWDLEIFEMIEDGKLVKACHLMLGDKQWAQFKAKPRKAKDFNELFVASQEALSTKSH